MRYWRSFMTVGRPTAHWAPKKKKKIFGRRKIVPIIHPNICDWVITSSHVKMCTITFTGCPVKLFPLCNLLFCRLLLIQITKVGTFLKNSENLLHDRHKNFENRFRNSWDNWGQSWQPSFRNWHFAITQRQKNIFYAKGGNIDLNYLSSF